MYVIHVGEQTTLFHRASARTKIVQRQRSDGHYVSRVHVKQRSQEKYKEPTRSRRVGFVDILNGVLLRETRSTATDICIKQRRGEYEMHSMIENLNIC
jgi:hypothetical protein